MDALAQLDRGLLMWIQSIRQEWMTPFWKAVTALGNAGWFWILLAIVLILVKKTQKTGVTVLLALIIGALVTNIIIKPSVARIRPYEIIEGLERLIRAQKDFSFPSGHSCAAFAAAFVCWNMMPKRYGALFVILAVLIAGSRLYLGVHYPSDVLGGILIGIAAGWAAVKIVTGGKHDYKA